MRNVWMHSINWAKMAKIVQINYTRQHKTHKSYAQTLNYELKWTAVQRERGGRRGKALITGCQLQLLSPVNPDAVTIKSTQAKHTSARQQAWQAKARQVAQIYALVRQEGRRRGGGVARKKKHWGACQWLEGAGRWQTLAKAARLGLAHWFIYELHWRHQSSPQRGTVGVVAEKVNSNSWW